MNYIPLTIGGIISVILIVKTLRLIRQESEVSEYKKVIIYPLIQFISILPAIISRVNDLVTGEMNFTLFLIYIITSRGQGAINALFWGKTIFKDFRKVSLGTSSFTPGGDPLFMKYDTSTICQNVSLVGDENKKN